MNNQFIYSLQGNPEGVQHRHGLDHSVTDSLELWCDGNGVHPLAGASTAAAGLPHLRILANVPHVYQVPS